MIFAIYVDNVRVLSLSFPSFGFDRWILKQFLFLLDPNILRWKLTEVFLRFCWLLLKLLKVKLWVDLEHILEFLENRWECRPDHWVGWWLLLGYFLFLLNFCGRGSSWSRAIIHPLLQSFFVVGVCWVWNEVWTWRWWWLWLIWDVFHFILLLMGTIVIDLWLFYNHIVVVNNFTIMVIIRCLKIIIIIIIILNRWLNFALLFGSTLLLYGGRWWLRWLQILKQSLRHLLRK